MCLRLTTLTTSVAVHSRQPLFDSQWCSFSTCYSQMSMHWLPVLCLRSCRVYLSRYVTSQTLSVYVRIIRFMSAMHITDLCRQSCRPSPGLCTWVLQPRDFNVQDSHRSVKVREIFFLDFSWSWKTFERNYVLESTLGMRFGQSVNVSFLHSYIAHVLHSALRQTLVSVL